MMITDTVTRDMLRRAESAQQTIRRYTRSFPLPARQYIDDSLEGFAQAQEAKDRAAALIVAVDAMGSYRDATELCEILNSVAPSADWKAECRRYYDDLLTSYKALYRFADEMIVLAKSADGDGMVDLVRDSQKFDSDFSNAMLNEPKDFQ